MNKHIEHRAIKGIEFRAAKEGSGSIGTLIGYAAVFNSDSVDMGGWVERIAPGAFKRTLTENPDVYAFWSHNSEHPIARTPNTLRLSEDDHGLRCEIDLIDTRANNDLLAKIRAGIVDSMSFGFRPVSQQWDSNVDPSVGDGDDSVRTLLDVDLFEVSPCVWPAYPDTSIAERSFKKFREVCEATPAVRSLSFKNEEPVVPATTLSDNINAKSLWEARARFL